MSKGNNRDWEYASSDDKGKYEDAYSRYKSSILTLEEQFAKPVLKKFVKTLKK